MLDVDPQLLTIHGLVVVLSLVIYAGVSVGRRQRRHPSAAVGWVMVLVLVPYLGLPLFLLFGIRKTGHDTHVHRSLPPLQLARDTAGRFQTLAVGLGLQPPAAYEDLVVHRDGPMALGRLRALVLGATRTLELSTYLLGRDTVGDALAALLMRRAQEGVRVRLLIDGVGRYLGGVPSLRALQRAGVEVHLFAPPWSAPLRGRLNLRNHRKLAIADGHWLWCGGRNLAAEYFERPGAAGPQPWVDLSFDLRGALAAQARQQFLRDWSFTLRTPLPPVEAVTAPAAGSPRSVGQLLPSGPDQPEDTVYQLLIEACFSAERRILVVTPYFVPDPALLMALTLAARRGVTVDLLVPRRSNHLLADLARPASVRELADAGARVWLVPSMLHAKLVVVDEALALAGSMNLDARSLFLNYELMVAFYEIRDVRAFAAWADALLPAADLVLPRQVSVLRELGEGLLRWLTFQV
jgi:cardiolipin synthase